VDKPRPEISDIKENEIRITTQGKMRNYISYATNLLTDQNKKYNEIVLKAMGRAINKTVTIAEIIKRRIPGLHQITQIDSTDITDVWEPLEEGLDRLETTRHVSSIQITLSTSPLDPNNLGYQPPLPNDQVKPITLGERPRNPRGRGGRGRFPTRGGRGRGGRGAGGMGMYSQGEGSENADGQQGPSDSSGEGRVRRPRGRGRGGMRLNRPPQDEGVSGGIEDNMGAESEGFRGRRFGGGGRGGPRGRGPRRGGRGRGGPPRFRDDGSSPISDTPQLQGGVNA